jgi:hypothetical protein
MLFYNNIDEKEAEVVKLNDEEFKQWYKSIHIKSNTEGRTF